MVLLPVRRQPGAGDRELPSVAPRHEADVERRRDSHEQQVHAERVAAVVEQLAQRARRGRAARLLAVEAVEVQVGERGEAHGREDPARRAVAAHVEAVDDGAEVGRDQEHQAEEGDEEEEEEEGGGEREKGGGGGGGGRGEKKNEEKKTSNSAAE